VTSEAPVSGLSARRAERADLPRLLELLADDMLGKNREGVGSDDPVDVRAFDSIDADPIKLCWSPRSTARWWACCN
jgi:hypothetical protein